MQIEQNKKYNQLSQDMKFCTIIYSKNKRLHSNERKLKNKTEKFTLIVFTYIFNLVSNIYNVEG